MQNKNYKCVLCEKTFGQAALLKIHVKWVHDEIQISECYICGKRYDSKNKLAQHLKLVHSKKPYKCETCFISYGHIANLVYVKNT